MLKKIVSLSLFVYFFTNILYAKNDKVVQIIANNIDTNGSIIIAKNDVLIFAPHYYITAQKAIYDKSKQTLELFDNVNISKDNKVITLSKYAFLDMKNNKDEVLPVLLLDKKSKIWVNAAKIEKKSDLNILKNSTISSCECYDPAWTIGFTSGDYNTTDKWINTYNNTLYIKGIPAWYFLVPIIPYANTPQLLMSFLLVKSPYFGFSTNKERRSGLLKPKFGYGSKDGFFYMQPIYWAPRKDLDLEFIPQIRELRGYGGELKYRYKDSLYSLIDLSIGGFKEKDDYAKENNLKNLKHYGWNFKYNRTKLFSSTKNNDGLLIDLKNMNDVEYINTKYNNKTPYTNQLLQSRIKYFYNTNRYYWDVETQHYHDISKDNDDNIMQVLPKIQLHKYSNKFIFSKLTNSIDIKYNRKTRKKGIGATTTNLSIPFSYNQYIFGKFLNLTFTEAINLTDIKYTNVNDYQNGKLLENKHIVSLDVDLLKPYDTTIHTIQFSTILTKPNIQKKEGDIDGFDDFTKDKNRSLNIFPVIKNKKNINFKINQTIYGKKSLKAIVNHKINQAIIYDDNGTSTLAPLENELTYFYDYGSLSNRSLYDHTQKIMTKSTWALKFKKDNFFTNIDYSYSKLTRDSNSSESITGKIGNKVLKYYTISYKEQYDISNHLSNLKEYGFTIDKKCWKLELKLADNLVVAATTTLKARRQNIIYATITLKPIVSIKQSYVQKEREE